MKKQYIQPTIISETTFAFSAILSSSPADDDSIISGNIPNPGGSSAPVRNTLIVK